MAASRDVRIAHGGLDRQMSESYRFTVAADAPASSVARPVLMWPERRPVPEFVRDDPYRAEYIEKRKAEGHAERMRTAGALLLLQLDPTRCRFGPRRVTLAGTLDAESPEQATATVLDLLQWTLAQVYGAERDYRRKVTLSGVRINLRAETTGARR